MKINKFILLLFIVLLAGALRFIQLGATPPSLTWDEVAWGYNAYSLGIDGKDEFGRFFPYDYLESFGDFKPPVYAYLDVVPVKLFGLNEFAVRFPSALFGVLTVFISYYLTRRIFWGSKHKDFYAMLTAGLLAISPWHIMLSRAAFEANVSTFFIVTGVWLFLKGIQEKPYYLIISVIPWVLSFYTFNTARVFVPMLVLVLLIAFWKKLLSEKKSVILAFILGLLLILPTVGFLFSDQAKLRFKEVNIFTDIEVIKLTNQEIANDENAWWSKVLHNRRLVYGVNFLNHYFDNLSTEFLFIRGDGNPKFSTQATGQLYLWEAPFLLLGILLLFRKREGKWWLVPLWLLLGIIPAATARETPHALRIETTLPMFQILVAYGIVNAFFLIKGKLFRVSLRPIFATSLLVVAIFNVAYFVEDYFRHYPKHFSGEWQYGYKEAVSYINSIEKDYSTVYLTPELGRPYAYLLFYKKFDPEVFRKEAIVDREALGFVTVKSIGKYYFNKTDLKKSNDALYVETLSDVPRDAKVKKTFYLLNGDPVLKAYTLN